MDSDMDFSELSNDKIESFLTAKLEAVRLQNQELEAVLNERQQVLQEMIPNIPEGITTGNFWKKVFNNKYAIGFEILSPTAFENVRVVLTCEFEEYLRYKVQTFTVSPEEGPCTEGAQDCKYVICRLIRQSEHFEDKAYVVVSFCFPQFLHTLEYDVAGHVICTLNGQDVDVPLPNIHLSANDAVTQANVVVEENSLPSLFTMVSCYNKIGLVICLPEEWRAPIASTFEIHCGLTYVRISGKDYYVANNISQLFDNTLVTIHPHKFKEGAENDVFLKVYTADDQQLYAFIHYILSCIQGSILFPSMFYRILTLSRKGWLRHDLKEKALEGLMKTIRKDIDLCYYYSRVADWKIYLADNKTYRFNRQREMLSESESETDLNYLRVLQG